MEGSLVVRVGLVTVVGVAVISVDGLVAVVVSFVDVISFVAIVVDVGVGTVVRFVVLVVFAAGAVLASKFLAKPIRLLPTSNDWQYFFAKNSPITRPLFLQYLFSQGCPLFFICQLP